MSSDLRVITRSAVTQIRQSMARPMMRFVVLFQPAVFVTITYFMFKASNVPGYGEYIVVGPGLLTLWMTILWSSATDIDRERAMGTLEVLIIAPVPFPITMLGKILGNTMLGVFSLALSYVYAGLLNGSLIPIAHPGLVLLTLILSTWSVIGFSLTLALIFTLYRGANVIANGLSFPVYLVSGLLFPLAMLPVPVRIIGLSMPLGWAKEAMRWAVVGQAGTEQLLTGSIWTALAGLTVIGTVYFVGAFLLFRYLLEYRIRRRGDVGVS